MHAPNAADITVDPERALLHTLDVAAAMTIAMMRVFFPVDHIGESANRGLLLVHYLVRDARNLRSAIARYRHYLDHQHDDQTTFPF